jgi:heptosyltransferase II
MTRHILVIRLGSLGDVLLASAPLLNLRLSFPDSQITLLTKERFAEIARLMPGPDRIITLHDGRSLKDYYDLLVDLDTQNFTDIVDLHGNLRSWLARRLVTASRRVVYPKRRRERADIVRTHQYPVNWPHTIDLYNQAVLSLDGQVYCQRPVLAGETSEAIAADILFRGAPYVVIAPGAAHPNKQWPAERFAELARQLHRQRGLAILWVTTATEAGTSVLNHGLPTDMFLELIDRPLPQLARLFSRAQLAITNDSGLMHLASAVGLPVLALFGPTHPTLGFAPRGQFDRILEVEEPCRPCSLHGKKPCYRSERFCFTRISVDDALSAATSMLDEGQSRDRALFIDRDGTLTVEKHFISDPAEVELVPGAAEALLAMKQRGFKLIVVSNQSGIARGFFTHREVNRVNDRLVELLGAQGVTLDGIYFCPHHTNGAVAEYAVPCTCRKPHPGLAERAARELGIDLRRSVVIGDKLDDLNLGQVIGARSILVRTGYGRKSEERIAQRSSDRRPAIVDNLPAAIRLLQEAGL